MKTHDFKVGDRVALRDEREVVGIIQKIRSDARRTSQDIITVRVKDGANKFDLWVEATDLCHATTL